jgi:hypothetical protein
MKLANRLIGWNGPWYGCVKDGCIVYMVRGQHHERLDLFRCAGAAFQIMTSGAPMENVRQTMRPLKWGIQITLKRDWR